MAQPKNRVNRRGFFKSAAASAAAMAVPGVVPVLNAGAIPEQRDVQTVDNPGSDFMADVLKTLGFEYIAANPASGFRGLHESLVTYGGNQNPEWLTCCHEEAAMNMASGYYAVEGRPMAVITFAVAGLHHAMMGIYGAYAGHTPTYLLIGNYADAADRRPGTDWNHSATDPAAPIGDLVKWSDNPASLQHFAESAVRAYKIAMTEPRGPVMLTVDATLQENAVLDRSALHIPRLTLTAPPAGDPVAVAEAAKMLVAAENPLIIAGDVARDESGRRLLVELAETLQAPVRGGARGMPTRHPLSGGGSVRDADVILALNVARLYGTLHDFRDQQVRTSTSLLRPGAKIITISTYDLYTKANYQTLDRFTEVDLAIAADPQATLPILIEGCKRLITADRRRLYEERGKRLAAASSQALERARVEATYGWNASPISQRRLEVEVWDVIRNKDWASVGGQGRLWNVDKFYQAMGAVDGGGVGGDLPIAIGAALAHKKHGRLCVRFQPDGDMMYVPGALWTATHHRIPLLLVMHNNRAYHQEVMHLQRMANRRQRGGDIAHRGFIGTTMTDPNIDFAQLARSMGAYAEGPIADPKALRPALLRAVERVEKGEVALLDTVVQPR